MKVFCRDCEYYFNNIRPFAMGTIEHEDCLAPNNIKKITKYYGEKIKYIKPPSRKNKHNDCKDFKEKGKIEPPNGGTGECAAIKEPEKPKPTKVRIIKENGRVRG